MSRKPEIGKFKIEELVEGKISSFEELITERMIDHFSEVSGDHSSLHTNEPFAHSRGFKGRVVHGAFLLGLFSRLVGMHLPGENAILQSINIQFLAPTYIGDKVLVKAFIDQISIATQTIVLKASVERISTQETLARGKIQVGFTAPKS